MGLHSIPLIHMELALLSLLLDTQTDTMTSPPSTPVEHPSLLSGRSPPGSRHPLFAASLSPMKGHGHSGNLSRVEQTWDLCSLALTLHGQIQGTFFFLSECYLFQKFYLFIYLFLAFVATCRLSPVVASGGLLSSCSVQASHAVASLGHHRF